MRYTRPAIDLGSLEEYIMSLTSGNIDDVVDFIERHSLEISPRGLEYVPEDKARKTAYNMLNALADEGKVRLNDREITRGGRVPYKLVFVTMG